MGERGSREDERARLLERAYGPEATPADHHALASFDRADLRRPKARGSATATATATAAAATTATRTTRAEGAGSAAAAPPEVVQPGGGPGDPSRGPEAGTPRRWPRRTVALAAGVAVGCLLVGVGAGILLASSSDQATGTAASTSAASADRTLTEIEQTLPEFQAPEAFDSPQNEADVPTGSLPPNLVRSSFRNAGIAGTENEKGLRIYVAKDTTHYDCVVADHSGRLASACVSGKYFPASGLTLTWLDPGRASTLTWLPDGSMTLATSPTS